MREINFKTENTVVEEKRLTLIHANADCQDNRTGNIVPLNFYWLKAIALSDVTSDEVKGLINLTTMSYGYEFVRMNTFESQPIYLDAEKMWKEDHEQKGFCF